MLYIFYGPDDFSRREALEELKAGLGGGDLLQTNTSVLEGKELTPAQLEAMGGAVPFLAPCRLVIVSGLLSRFEPRPQFLSSGRRPAPEGGKPMVEPWQNCILSLPPTTTTVLIEEDLSQDNPLFVALAAQATVRKFPLFRAGELQAWIRSRVAAKGDRLSPAAERLLAELVGSQLGILDSELEKLCLYAQGRVIEEEDVRQLVGYVKESRVFALVDAILERQGAQAVSLLHRLLTEGATLSYLITMMARQLRLLVLCQELQAENLSPPEAARRLGVASVSLYHRLVRQAQSYALDDLQDIYGKLLETDLAVKTGRLNEELALDLLVAELCQPRKRARG